MSLSLCEGRFLTAILAYRVVPCARVGTGNGYESRSSSVSYAAGWVLHRFFASIRSIWCCEADGATYFGGREAVGNRRAADLVLPAVSSKVVNGSTTG